MLVKAFGCKQQKETEARKGGVYGKGAGSSQLTKGHKKRTSSFGEAGPRPPQGSWELGGGWSSLQAAVHAVVTVS